MSRPCTLLVIGEAGQGKSTLIDHFLGATNAADRERINKLIPKGLVQTGAPKCGDDTGGVTKEPAFYPARIGKRDVILIDMPGMQAGDQTAAARPAELLDRFQKLISQTRLPITGVISCVQVGNRLTMGQDFCQKLVTKCLHGTESSEDKWSQILVVGTKADTYYCGKKSHLAKCKEWRLSYMKTVNTSEYMVTDGVRLSKCILVNVCVDAEEDDETDVDTLVKEIESLEGELAYREISDEDLCSMMNEAFGKVVVTKEELKLVREVDPYGKTFAALAGGAFVVQAANLGALVGGDAIFAGVVAGEQALGLGAAQYFTATGAAIIGAGPLVAGAVTLGGVGYLASKGYLGESLGMCVNETAKFASNPLKEGKIVYDRQESMIVDTPTLTTQITCGRRHEICAYLSSHIYTYTDDETATAHFKDNFESIGIAGVQHAAVIHSLPDDPHTPAILLVRKSTMYIAWRGTKTVMDVLIDMDCLPVASPLWHEAYPRIKVHNGMAGKLQNDFLEYIPEIQRLAAKFEVTEIIFTGHSLGGGLAQIALLAALGQKASNFRMTDPKLQPLCAETFNNAFKPVQFQAVVFGAPMIFHVDDVDGAQPEDESAAVLTLLCDGRSVNYVYDDDMVPRFPAHTKFLLQAIPNVVKAAATEWVQKEFAKGFLPASVSGYFGRQISHFTKAKLEEVLAKVGTAFHNYQHACRIIMCHETGAGVQKGVYTPEKFAELSESDWDAERSARNAKFMIEFHSVCPDCVGGYQHAIQAQRVAERVAHYERHE
jgi:hypothetical protein